MLDVKLIELLSSFNQGDREAFGHLFNHFYGPLCLFSQRITQDAPMSEDIVQESFVKLWEKRPSFEKIEVFKSFLYSSVKNASLNYLEHHSVKQKYQKHVINNGPVSEKSILHNIIRAEVLRQTFDAIDTLPEQCRRVIKMTFEEGKKPKEISAELGITISTVNNQKMRGLSILRTKLPDDRLGLAISILTSALISHIK